ncbi:unnamed protein product [Coccothraustes coccothraustes]
MVSALCQHCATGTHRLRDLSSHLQRGRPSAPRPRVEAGTSRTVATATSASLRTAAGRGYLRVEGRPRLPSPQGAPARPASATEGREGRAAAAGQCQGKGFTPQKVSPKMLRALFFLPPAPRRRGGTACGCRAGRTRESPQRAAGREKPSAASAAEGAPGPPQRGSCCSRSR